AFGTEAAPAFPKLRSLLLSDSDSSVRWSAIKALGGLSAANVEAQSLIVERLQDTSPYIRSGAVAALGRLGESSRKYLPQFIAALTDPSDLVRDEAAKAIDALGAAGASAFPAMIDASRLTAYNWDLVRTVRDIALKQSVSPVPLLIAALNDPQNSTDGRLFAADSLGELGTLARVAAPDLLKASKEGPERVRRAAAEALAKVAPETLAQTALTDWIEMLASNDTSSQNRAQHQLKEAGGRSVPLLLDIVRNDGAPTAVRVRALWTLGWIGGNAEVAVSTLMEIANGDDSIEIQ